MGVMIVIVQIIATQAFVNLYNGMLGTGSAVLCRQRLAYS